MPSSYTSTEFIAKEGWGKIAIVAILFFIAWHYSCLNWFFFFVLCGTVYLYRNPERIPQEDDHLAILAPIDGTIKDISKITLSDKQEMLQIVVKKSLCDVGILRAPFKLEIEEQKNRFGFFMNSNHPLHEQLNEHKVVTCASASGLVKMVISIGQFGNNVNLFRKAVPFKPAERMGFLMHGDVTLCLPLDARMKVAVNDHVKAGESVLGYFSGKDLNEHTK